MEENPYEIPLASDRLAIFRAGRLASGVTGISASAEAFRNKVGAAIVTGASDDGSDVTKAFIKCYHSLSEALDAARASNLVQGPAGDAIDAIMKKLRTEYSNGLESMRDDVRRLRDQGPTQLHAFCTHAVDKIDRLEQFWRSTFPDAPRVRVTQ